MKQEPWQVSRTLKLRGNPPDLSQQIAGVLQWQAKENGRYWVCYDVREVQFATLAKALNESHASGMFWRWRVAWYQFQDENNRDNLLAKDGPCCNRPPR